MMDRQHSQGRVRRHSMGDILQINHYHIEKEIGKGAHGTVLLAVDTDVEPPKEYAIKVIRQHLFKKKKRAFGRHPSASAITVNKNDPEKMLEREIAILKKIDHPHLVNLVEVIEDQSTQEIFLVMEYLPGGSIMPDVEEYDPISEQMAWHYFRQLIEAVEYCHANGVIHCDIKPANLLLCGENNVKVADFGTSHIMEETDVNPEENDQVALSRTDFFDDTVSKVMGTTQFLSPQAFQGEPYSGKALDIWSCGVTLFFFVYGRCPFTGEDTLEIHDNILEQELEFPETPVVSEDLKDLLNKILEKDEKKRLDIDAVLDHPWITHGGKDLLEHHHYKPVEVTEDEISHAIVEEEHSRSFFGTLSSTFSNSYAELKRKISRSK